MTSHPVRCMALFLGIVVPLQLAIPLNAQESVASPAANQADHQIDAGQIDAPSATLAKEQAPSQKVAPVEMAQAQETPPAEQPVQKDDSAKPQSDQGTAQQPEGAAAAQIQPTTGTAGSKPAGAALAPPKQRRVRSLLIRLGAVAGAGIALGTVYALSTASPSKPPGTH